MTSLKARNRKAVMPTTRQTRSMTRKAIATTSNALSLSPSTSTLPGENIFSVSNAVATYGIFHPFPKLPVEIRQSIWLLSDAVPGPKILWASALPSLRSDSSGRKVYRRPVPKVLHICRETRDEFMDSGSVSGGRRSHITWRMVDDMNKYSSNSSKGGIFISMVKDSVVIDRNGPTSVFHCNSLLKLENLILHRHSQLSSSSIYIGSGRAKILKGGLMKLDNLQTVTIMLSDDFFEDHAPEHNGEYDVDKLGTALVLAGTQYQTTTGELFARRKALQIELHDEIKKKHGDWMVPRVKMRTECAVWRQVLSQD